VYFVAPFPYSLWKEVPDEVASRRWDPMGGANGSQWGLPVTCYMFAGR
jgi:hypothetical protein